MRYSKLGRANGMCYVDIESCVSSPVRLVSARAAIDAWRMPEVTPVGIVDACSWTCNVDFSELLYSYLEHALQLRPIRNIGLEKDGSWFPLLFCTVFFDQLLCFWAKRKIGYKDGAAMAEK